MADNFNLRSFLIENKLTKNAQLLSEGQVVKRFTFGHDLQNIQEVEQHLADNYEEGVDFVMHIGRGDDVMNTLDILNSSMLEDGELLSLVRACKGGGTFNIKENAQFLKEEVSLNGKPINVNSIEIEGIDTSDYPDFVDAYIVAADYADGTPLTDDEVEQFQEEHYDIVGELIHDRQLYLQEKKEKYMDENLNEASDYGFDALMDAADDLYPEGTPENGKLVFAIEKALHANKIDTSEFGHDPSAASRAVQAIAREIGLNETTNKMTAKERKLVKMVQEAMGMGEENVDYTMGRQDDPNQLPNPAPELNIPEGDEMAKETVIPEYKNIEELLKGIEEGTNKVAEEHKIQEMKKIAQMLREKARKMEESEHAAHISPKDLKQLATDAAKLEKAAEKLKAAFDKKFNKKEKAAAPKAEKVEALQEGFFDLRKFLAENRKK